MQRLNLFFLVAILGATQTAYAQVPSHCMPARCVCLTEPEPATNGWFVDVGLGRLKQNGFSNNYLMRDEETEADNYTIGSISRDSVISGSIGYLWSRPKNWFPSLSKNWFPAVSVGMNYKYISPIKVDGQIEEFSDPEFTNYNYNYQLDHEMLSLFTKLNIYRFNRFSPYVLFGIGSSWNRSSDYHEIAMADVDPAREPPQFGDKTDRQFAYDIGLGIDFMINENLSLSLAYDYLNFSSNETGFGKEEFFEDKKLQNRSHANSLSINLRYLFI